MTGARGRAGDHAESKMTDEIFRKLTSLSSCAG
jgi:hypothetical protein